VSIGGGSKSPLWRQIKADITGKKVVTLKNKETGCLGTAIYAGYGCGAYESIDGAVQKLVETNSVTLPKAEKESADALYKRYLALDKLLLNRKDL
jgi:xylulokinase